jgi:hypothetical protein
MQHTYCNKRISLLLKTLLLLLLRGFGSKAYSQVSLLSDSVHVDSLRKTFIQAPPSQEDLSKQYDLGNLYNNVLRPHKTKALPGKKKTASVIVIPNVAANPTLGGQAGIKAVAGKKFGDDPKTFMSVAATSASISTKGIVIFYVTHNVFTSGNKWNLQGSVVASRSVSPDFGQGIGKVSDGSADDQILADNARKGRALVSKYLNLKEKVYKEVRKGLFVGMGFSFDMRRNITEKDTNEMLTPYGIYNERHGFNNDHYFANGLLFDIQYTTRDNQNRAYKGIYINGGFRLNQTWLGSSRSGLQFNTDIRKYISLSSNHPEHVIAFWNWGGYVVAGDIPYLELPGTGKDMNFRSGRGYTVGYFKSTQFNYTEVEYRFPILNNKFVSGVAFANLQTANDASGTKLFQVWRPGYGGGLRILLNKATRTNLCLDYAFGQFKSKGFFLGLNEAF